MLDFKKYANESHIRGLKFIPKLLYEESNDQDFLTFVPPHLKDVKISSLRGDEPEFSKCNAKHLKTKIQSLGRDCKCVLEIGVHRNGDSSSTNVILDTIPDHCVYIGIDLDDKSYMHDPAMDIHMIQGDSSDQEAVYTLMQKLDIYNFDFIFIDGNHSLNQVIKDWRYVERLAPHGIVGLHDTNYHIGPKLLLEAIDEKQFLVEKYCEFDNDWGISFASKWPDDTIVRNIIP